MNDLWYVTEYGPDRKRVHPRPNEISINAPSGGADVVWTNEELGSLLIERGICHMGRKTSYEDGSPAVAIVHLANGNWLAIERSDKPWSFITDDGLWAASCPRACWHPDEQQHVIHLGAHL